MPGPGVATVPSIGPPLSAWTTTSDYSAQPGNLIYSGWARSLQNSFTFVVSGVTAAAAAVFTTSANHGLISGNHVAVSGATGDWAGLNGIQTITVLSPTTFSVPVNSSAYAGSFNGVLKTTSPRTNAACWAISKSVYDGSNQLTWSGWASGSPGDAFVWDLRATLTYS